MSSNLLAIFGLFVFVSVVNSFGPLNLVESFTGSWKKAYSADKSDIFRMNGTTIAWITQRVDNFNSQNNATFQQRYFSNNEYFRDGGPLYVIFNSQQPASNYDIDYSLIASVARSENGHVFLLENRYFGQSIPTANLSVENLQFMTVEQALADGAHFINHIKKTTAGAQNSPVVVLGRHYGGSMAVWFRQKYPHLTSGAWASSAPLMALQNHQQYKENAGAAIRELAGDECYSVIEAGFRDVEQLAHSNELDELNGLFNVCEDNPIRTDNDVSSLFLILSEFFSSISSFRPLVPYVCEVLLQNMTTTPAQALANVKQWFHGPSCLPVDYEEFIRRDSVIDIDSEQSYLAMRQVSYQLCTQLGWFTTSESPNQPFGSFYPLAFFTEICTRVFGSNVANHAIAQSNQDRFNVEHGGVNPWISNALFSFGDKDPNRHLLVQRDLHESAVVLSIRDAAIAYDFHGISQYDDQELIDAKLDIMAIIRSWTR